MRLALLIVAACLAAPAFAQAPLSPVVLSNAFRVVPGAAQGARGDLVYMPAGTIQGVHVIQGGSRECLDATQLLGPCDERERSLNLDIGAGSTSHPGTLALNFDVGKCVVIFDGKRRRLASFCKDGITFYRKPRIKK
jgi:hypothetical protein